MRTLLAVPDPTWRRRLGDAFTTLLPCDLLVTDSVAGVRAVVAAQPPGHLAVVASTLTDAEQVCDLLVGAGWEQVVVCGAGSPARIAAALASGVGGWLVPGPGGRRAGGGPTLPVTGADGVIQEVSRREAQVLQLLAAGADDAAVGRALGVSVHTAKTHVARMARRLGARNRAHLVLLACRAGVVR